MMEMSARASNEMLQRHWLRLEPDRYGFLGPIPILGSKKRPISIYRPIFFVYFIVQYQSHTSHSCVQTFDWYCILARIQYIHKQNIYINIFSNDNSNVVIKH